MDRLSELLERIRHRGSAQPARRSGSETLILFYNTMWGAPAEIEGLPLPAGCRLTHDRREFGRAAAVVFHVPTLFGLPRSKPPGQLWVAWSMECEANYPQLRDPAYMRRFDLTMTYRLDADVVAGYAPYYSDAANLEQALRTPPRPKSAEKLAALFISADQNRSGRLEYAAELMRHLEVHSYGKVLRNRQLEDDRWRPTKLAVIADYRFTLAFENAIAEDYVTEKFFDPLIVGSVPVYLGAPNVETFAPGDHCFINTADFPRPKDLADYLLHLQRDDSAYAAYLDWKERPFRPAFLEVLARQRTPAFVRLCQVVQRRLGRSVTFVGAEPPGAAGPSSESPSRGP